MVYNFYMARSRPQVGKKFPSGIELSLLERGHQRVHSNQEPSQYLGQGNRHIVWRSGHWVIRVQKILADNTIEASIRSETFHTNFTGPYLVGFVCPVEKCEYTVCRFAPNLTYDKPPKFHCIRTCCLKSSFTVELKPKSALVERPGCPPRFVLQQIARGDVGHRFDPSPIWDGTDRSKTAIALYCAKMHPKAYLQASRWRAHNDRCMEMMVNAIHTPECRSLLFRLEALQKVGVDDIAKMVASIARLLPVEDTRQPDINLMVPELFREELDSLIRTEDRYSDDWIRRANDAVDLFLAARMAMDVSLLFNFTPPGEPEEITCGHLKLIPLPDGWKCRIGVVDTELKHRWKVPQYAIQFDSLIDSCC